MRRLLLALPSILFALAALTPIPTAASSACYCVYGENHGSWDAQDRLYCPNQFYYAGGVETDDHAAATAQCAQKCLADGTVSAGIKTDTRYGEPANVLQAETDKCIFTATPLNNYQRWTPGMDSCRQPVNYLVGNPIPQSCSFCYCKFKAGGSTPEACAGKTTRVGMGLASTCPALCGRLGLDADGSGVAAYGDKCDYQLSNGCAEAQNFKGEGCAGALAKSAEVRQIATNRGSVVGLSLPLSNISPEAVIGRIIRAIVGLTGTIALLMFIWGGLQWMLAAGDASKVAAGKKTITWATLGIFAIASAYAILNFIINAIRN